MSRRSAIAAASAVLLLIVLVSTVYMTDWDDTLDKETSDEWSYTENGVRESESWFYQGGSDNNHDVGVDSEDEKEDSLNYVVFEKYGPLLLVLGIVMFGAMIGGLCVAREEIEKDEPADTKEEN